MISSSSGALRPRRGVIAASELRALRRRGRVPRTVQVVGAGGGDIVVTTSETRAGYGGRRPWFLCPLCTRRVGMLLVLATGVACRRCTRYPYESRRSRGSPWWKLWGSSVWKLARVRAELARRYLRLARRGELERLEARLVEQVCRGLAADQSAAVHWERTGLGEHWFGVAPYGLGYDWHDEAGGVVPIV
jgi:hypothetical protein